MTDPQSKTRQSRGTRAGRIRIAASVRFIISF
jgi:hypothetical protein